MSYILEFFDQLVSETLQPGKIRSVDNDHLKELHEMSFEEKRKTLFKLMKQAFRCKNNEELRIHICGHYSIVEFLINLCNEYELDPVYVKDGWYQKFLSHIKESLHQLATFISGRFSRYLNSDNTLEDSTRPEKVHCSLSVDQLALIFRAAFDEKILPYKSLNSMFQSIAPLLSTTSRTHLSYNSMRSKSYAAESRDKNYTIEILNQLIKRVEEY